MEWMESARDGVNDLASETRTLRGGSFFNDYPGMLSSYREGWDPTRNNTRADGFRVAAVPEPLESAGVLGVATLGFALWRRRGSL